MKLTNQCHASHVTYIGTKENARSRRSFHGDQRVLNYDFSWREWLYTTILSDFSFSSDHGRQIVLGITEPDSIPRELTAMTITSGSIVLTKISLIMFSNLSAFTIAESVFALSFM